jgi:hypothetical protein
MRPLECVLVRQRSCSSSGVGVGGCSLCGSLVHIRLELLQVRKKLDILKNLATSGFS